MPGPCRRSLVKDYARPYDVTLDRRRFRPTRRAGEVDAGTTFGYHEDGDLVRARYAGGAIRLGFLVGVRDWDALFARYAHVGTDGGAATGHTESRIEVLADGRVRLHEDWLWDPREGP